MHGKESRSKQNLSSVLRQIVSSEILKFTFSLNKILLNEGIENQHEQGCYEDDRNNGLGRWKGNPEKLSELRVAIDFAASYRLSGMEVWK